MSRWTCGASTSGRGREGPPPIPRNGDFFNLVVANKDLAVYTHTEKVLWHSITAIPLSNTQKTNVKETPGGIVCKMHAGATKRWGRIFSFFGRETHLRQSLTLTKNTCRYPLLLPVFPPPHIANDFPRFPRTLSNIQPKITAQTPPRS